MPGPPDGNLRGQVSSDRTGATTSFGRCFPGPYTIPLDGPTGKMTAAADWSPWRPAHIHLIVSADDHEPLVTQLFIDSSDYLDSDVASAVKDPLIVHPEHTGDGQAGDRLRLRARACARDEPGLRRAAVRTHAAPAPPTASRRPLLASSVCTKQKARNRPLAILRCLDFDGAAVCPAA